MKILLVCTSGGHFSTMMGLRPFWSNHERTWVTDLKRDTQIIEGKEKVYWLPYQGPRDLWILIKNLLSVFKILWHEKPDLIITTGASISIGFTIASKILRSRFVYIESISRSEELSVSGKIAYHLADEFYVQWPQLAKKYPKAMFRGNVGYRVNEGIGNSGHLA